VLEREQGEQPEVDDDRRHARALEGPVDGPRHAEAPDEADGVEKRREEDPVAHDPVCEDAHSTNHASSLPEVPLLSG
jgi:hypothetical protein